MNAAILLLILVPAPPHAKERPCPIVGTFEMQWGGSIQQSTFRSDGTCDSPQFGPGTWTIDGNTVYFSERDRFYAMVIDWDTLTGVGAYRNEEDGLEFRVEVILKRRPAPKK